VQWRVGPRTDIRGRTLLVLDDILDEGNTLAAIKERLLDQGAGGFYSAVFADKEIGKPKPIRADFVGVSVPDRYVFGFGMDVNEYWRNLPAIYALRT
jgi:hypoxanthine phosphoribosyltransferase